MIRQQLSSIHIHTLRPVDIAWNYVVLYNEKIRKLWNHCNQNDPYEKDRVMRQIDDLDHKRQQRLAEANQLPDCPVRTWDFVGFVEPEYRKALPPLEPEPVEQPETSKQPEPVVTQAPFTDVASIDLANGSSDPNVNFGVPETDLDRMGSFELDGQSHFDTAFEEVTYSQRNDTDLPGLDVFEDSLFIALSTDAASNQLDAAELAHLQQETQGSASSKQMSTTGDNVNNDDGFLFGSGHKQLGPASVSFQVVGEPQNPENASHASLITQQPSLEEQATHDDDSLFGDDVEEISFETAPSPNQIGDEPQTSSNTGSDVHDASDFLNSGPIAQPDHSPEAQLDPESEALYAQEFEASFAHGLEAEPQTAEQPAPDNQAAQDAAPVEQVALAPPVFQTTSDQIEAAGGEGAPALFMPQNPIDDEQPVPDYRDYRLKLDHPPEHYHKIAREQLARFWPGNQQECSNMQLELFATGSEQFQQMELENYKNCYKAKVKYLVHFEDEYKELPSNKKVVTICNGHARFRCLLDKLPAQDASYNVPLDTVDLTGDDSTTADPLGVQEPALASPAEIVAADEAVSATAGGESDANGPATPEGQEAATREVPKIPTPPPVDEVTFAQGPVSLTNNTEPTTPVQSDADGNNGTWSSDWSGKAFADGGQPPKAPSNQEIGVMECSVTSDNSSRGTKAPKQAGNAPGSLSSVHTAHNALNHQLSQTSQAAGNVHAPPSAEPTERGNKRRRKNAGAAADRDVSQGQQHGAPEHQPAQYYGPSPHHNLDAKKWVEDHTQGGKGKRGQKRKAQAPKKTPPPRKARKAQEATPSAPPRSYCNIAPAPARNQGDANNVQMQSRSSTSMEHGGATGPSNTQMNGNSNQVRSTTPYMQIAQSQQGPSPQEFQNPMGQWNHSANTLQQPPSWWEKVANPNSKREWLSEQWGLVEEEESNLISNNSMQQGFQQPPQQGNLEPQSHELTGDEASNGEVQELREELKAIKKLIEFQRMPQSHMAMPRMMPSQPMPSNGVAPFSMSMQEGYRQASPSAGYPPTTNFPQNGYPATNFPQYGYPVANNFPQNGYPATNFPQNGYPPANNFPQNGYPPANNFPQNGYPPANNFPQSGYPAHMNFNPFQGTNGQGMYGGFDEGIGGAYMAQEGMPDFST